MLSILLCITRITSLFKQGVCNCIEFPHVIRFLQKIRHKRGTRVFFFFWLLKLTHVDADLLNTLRKFNNHLIIIRLDVRLRWLNHIFWQPHWHVKSVHCENPRKKKKRETIEIRFCWTRRYDCTYRRTATALICLNRCSPTGGTISEEETNVSASDMIHRS